MKLPNWTKNLILMLISISICLLAAEWVFRKIIFSDSEAATKLRTAGNFAKIYPDDFSDIFSEEYWLMYYHFGGFFQPPANPHPLLGWIGKFNRETLRHNDENQRGNRRPVLLFGDSFAHCVKVKCFEEMLNQDSSFADTLFLLNYGVGGYGFDQIYLMYKEVVDKFDNPFIVFSVMTRDMDRSILKVRTGQKPYFKLVNGELELQGVPINPNPEEFYQANKPEPSSYLYRFFRNSKMNPFPRHRSETKEVVQEMKDLNKAILLKAIEDIRSRNLDHLFLVFDPMYRGKHDWRTKFIREVLKEQKVPFIFTRDLVDNEGFKDGDNYKKYEQLDNGHPTEYQNQLISDAIDSFIGSASFRDSLHKANHKD